MEEKRKSRSWLLWIVIGLLSLLLAYPLSFGPVLWVDSNDYFSEPVRNPVLRFYEPLVPFFLDNSRDPISRAYRQYLFWWLSVDRRTVSFKG